MSNRICSLSASLFLAAALYAQAPAAAPAFEVASIKPAGPLDPAAIAAGRLHIGVKVDGAQVDIGFLSLADLLRVAYDVKPFQISGPDWMKQQRFDILAKLPESATSQQVPAMLQTLLAERFKLAVHKENKEQSVYALVVGKNGPKLKESAPDEPAAAPGDGAPAPPPPPPVSSGGVVFSRGDQKLAIQRSGNGAVIAGGPNGSTKVSMGPNGTIHMEVGKMTMAQFADTVTTFVDRPVVDMTELKGTYQVALDLAMEDLVKIARTAGVGLPGVPPGGGPANLQRPADAASDPSGSSIFTAVQQLGLRLDARKAPMETIVVDHLEKTPTEN